MPQLINYATATPVMADQVAGVADPAGTWSVKLFSFADIRDLLQANLTSITVGGDVKLERDAANVLAQRNGTTAQKFYLYNTFTDASNYERGVIKYASNRLVIGHEFAGTGANREVILTNGSLGGAFRFAATDAGSFSYLTLVVASNPALRMRSGGMLEWASGSDAGGTANTRIDSPAAGIIRFQAPSTTGEALELHEMTAPSAGGANTVRIYAEDNGAGKTRLMALFSTGAAQQIAIEP